MNGVPSLQLGTGKTAGWLVGWLVGGKTCLSVACLLSRVNQSVRARFAHISGTGRPIDFLFDPMVGFSGTADRMDLLPVAPNPRWRLAAILENFKWPYLRNGSSDRLRV